MPRPYVHLQQLQYGSFDFSLSVPELLIAFVPKDLSEHSHVIVLIGIVLDSTHYATCPVDCQILYCNNLYLQPIFLVEEGEQILVHGLSGKPALVRLLVEFDLRLVNLFDSVLQLLQGYGFRGWNGHEFAGSFLRWYSLLVRITTHCLVFSRRTAINPLGVD